jgi:hypothetical protein
MKLRVSKIGYKSIDSQSMGQPHQRRGPMGLPTGLLREVAQQPTHTVHPSAEGVQVQLGNYVIKG